jgi:hypothetical protein
VKRLRNIGQTRRFWRGDAVITDREIEQKAAEFRLPPQQVEKDYVHSWILWAINSKPELGRLLVLKGGNALRKCYFPDTRFSFWRTTID